MAGPLNGLLVLDFSTMVPGPFATLMLSEAGAEVVKIERPVGGDELRLHGPNWQGESLPFAMLNRGKKSIELDLKSPDAMDVLRPLIERADILIEQFRPGVMERLGFGYSDLREINPRLIYCSITGYGQTGPKSSDAGHDLNYLAESGLLSVSSGPQDHPTVPPGLIGDIGGGSYPAMINILLALMTREKTGKGSHIDIAMSEGLFAYAFWAYAMGAGCGLKVGNGTEILSGGTPRYRLYPASDGRLIAVAAMEPKFWQAFCETIDLAPELRDDRADPDATTAGIAKILSGKTGAEWRAVFDNVDCCCSVVQSMDEVARDPHFIDRGLFAHKISSQGGETIAAMPLPMADEFRAPTDEPKPSPTLGGENAALKKPD